MKSCQRSTVATLWGCICVMLLSALPVAGQNRDKGPWWPHPIWGRDDQAGASNWMTPEKVLEAISLVSRHIDEDASRDVRLDVLNPEPAQSIWGLHFFSRDSVVKNISLGAIGHRHAFSNVTGSVKLCSHLPNFSAQELIVV